MPVLLAANFACSSKLVCSFWVNVERMIIVGFSPLRV
jgi:hypothetical protein